jgi:hypothetical protein
LSITTVAPLISEMVLTLTAAAREQRDTVVG